MLTAVLAAAAVAAGITGAWSPCGFSMVETLAPAGYAGRLLTDADGRPLPIASRTRICDAVADLIGFDTQIDGAWFRCCGGQVRKLVDCCSYSTKRINGDASLTGYCYKGRRVYCVMYFDTKVKC